MAKIAEKPEFMKARAIKVCAKQVLKEMLGTKKYVFLPIFNKPASVLFYTEKQLLRQIS